MTRVASLIPGALTGVLEAVHHGWSTVRDRRMCTCSTVPGLPVAKSDDTPRRETVGVAGLPWDPMSNQDSTHAA
jgi:hypothetical protein